MRNSALALIVLALAAPALAQDEDYRNARIRSLEPGVTLQRASETAAEEAAVNLPFVPGDRVWTDDAGRVEFQFDDGSFLRLDSRSKLDFLGDSGGPTGLRIWSGGLYLHMRRDSAGFEIETPGGRVEASERGVYRIDADSGETRLTVYQGEASLTSGRRRVRVESGERTYARQGEPPESPRGLDRADDDEFARWDRDREGRTAWAGDDRRYLPDQVAPYADELESNGSWYYETEVGYVWRPSVAGDWRPYSNGRWTWTPYGWTWVPYESWGWAPFHYGRWGFSGALGWYWIPGGVWSPAWVSWAVGADYVGWCPLGYRDRPVYYDGQGRGGHAIPRGSLGGASVADAAASKAWVMVRKGDLAARDLATRRVALTPADVKEVRVMDSPRVRPTRDLGRTIDARTLPRDGRTKPTIGDFVPELRSDPKTTIPLGVPRSRQREDENIRPRERVRTLTPESRDRQIDSGHPTDDRHGVRTLAPESRERSIETLRPVERAHPTDDRDRVRTPANDRPPSRVDQDRDVLRRFFQPVSERSRDDGRVTAPPPERRVEPRAEPPQRRPEPRAVPQQRQPERRTPPPASDHAKPPQQKDKKP